MGCWMEKFVLPSEHMYLSKFVFTLCSPIKSINMSPTLNITGLPKLEMVSLQRDRASKWLQIW